jgi:Domain of unknown function (DUF4190)
MTNGDAPRGEQWQAGPNPREAQPPGQEPQSPTPPERPAQQPPPPGPEAQPAPSPGVGAVYPPTQTPFAYQNPPNAPGAVPALVLGILGLAFCALCAPFAVWQGQRARQAVDRSGGALGGRGMATAGFVTGIIGSVLLAIAVLGLIVLVAASGS